MDDLDLLPGLLLARCRPLERREQAGVDELAEDGVCGGSVHEKREELAPVLGGARSLRRRQVSEDLPNYRLGRSLDGAERPLGMLGERSVHPPDLEIGLPGEDLPHPIPLLP